MANTQRILKSKVYKRLKKIGKQKGYGHSWPYYKYKEMETRSTRSNHVKIDYELEYKRVLWEV